MPESATPGPELEWSEVGTRLAQGYEAVKSKPALLLALAITGAALGVVYAAFNDTKYEAALTFTLNQNSQGGGISAGLAFLGQFGFGGMGSESNLLQLSAVAKSRRIARATLNSDFREGIKILDKVEAEYTDRFEDIRGAFKTSGDSFENYEAKLRVGSKILVGRDGSSGLLGVDYDEDSGVITLSCTTTDSVLSIEIVSKTYDHLQRFYKEEETEQSRLNYERLALKTDSVEQALQTVDRKLATLRDRTNSVLLERSRGALSMLEREKFMLSTLYGEMVKNREATAFMISTQSPVFQVIDNPEYGVEKKAVHPAIAGVIGISIGIILAIGFILGRAALGY